MSIIDRVQKEPAFVSGLVAAVIALGVSFGLDLSEEQVGAIMAVTAAVLALVLAGALVLLYAANRLTHPKIGA